MKALSKRNFRILKKNFIRHFSLFILILISSMVMVGISNSIDSVSRSVKDMFADCQVEDGFIQCDTRLSEQTAAKLRSMGIQLEEETFHDAAVKGGRTVRIFSDRVNIDRLAMIEGEKPAGDNEIALSRGFARKNGYRIGNEIEIENKKYRITGYAASPDYVNALAELTDAVSGYDAFGLGYLSVNEAARYFDKAPGVIQYAYLLNGNNPGRLKEIVEKDHSIISMVSREENARISNYEADINVTKNVSLVIAMALVVIVAFAICIYISAVVEAECVTIGTLFSLGLLRKELCRHYMTMPVCVVSCGSILGTVLGFTCGNVFVQSMIDSYNFPAITRVYRPYCFLLGLVFPILMVTAVNLALLWRRLSIEPLRLLRKDIKKHRRVSRIRFRTASFMRRFRRRELLRNKGNFFVLTIGVILSVFMLMFSFGIWNSLTSYIADMEKNIKYEYCYYLNTNEIPDIPGAEKVSIRNMKMSFGEKTEEKVVLNGIDEDNRFYDFHLPESEEGAAISSNISEKYNIAVGDELTLRGEGEEKGSCRVRVAAIVEDKTGFSIFMNRRQMNRMLGADQAFYNALLSGESLSVGEDAVYKRVTKEGLVSDMESVMNRLIPLCILIIAASVCICILLITILIKVQFDQSAFSVSLVSVFGYNRKELTSVYLTTVKAALAAGLLIGIPVSYLGFVRLWPMLTASMQTYVRVGYHWYCFAVILLLCLACYAVSIARFRSKLRSVHYAEAMKARE